MPKKKPGRPKGAKTRHTSSDLNQLENEIVAMWGQRGGSVGGWWAHEALCWRNPNPARQSVTDIAKLRGISPQELIAERKSEPPPEWMVQHVLEALDNRDAQFFRDAADALERIKNDHTITADDLEAASLMAFVDIERQGKKERKFTVAELQSVDLGRDANGQIRRLSETQAYRLAARLHIPMQQGRPKK